jgi:hypothetical protein
MSEHKEELLRLCLFGSLMAVSKTCKVLELFCRESQIIFSHHFFIEGTPETQGCCILFMSQDRITCLFAFNQQHSTLSTLLDQSSISVTSLLSDQTFIPTLGKVHSTCYSYALSFLQTQLLPILQTCLRNGSQSSNQSTTPQLPPIHLLFTGHGIGGGVASIVTLLLHAVLSAKCYQLSQQYSGCSEDLLALFKHHTISATRIRCISFGMPLITDPTAAHFLNIALSARQAFLHFVHQADFLPRITFLTYYSYLATHLNHSNSISACCSSTTPSTPFPQQLHERFDYHPFGTFAFITVEKRYATPNISTIVLSTVFLRSVSSSKEILTNLQGIMTPSIQHHHLVEGYIYTLCPTFPSALSSTIPASLSFSSHTITTIAKVFFPHPTSDRIRNNNHVRGRSWNNMLGYKLRTIFTPSACYIFYRKRSIFHGLLHGTPSLAEYPPPRYHPTSLNDTNTASSNAIECTRPSEHVFSSCICCDGECCVPGHISENKTISSWIEFDESIGYLDLTYDYDLCKAEEEQDSFTGHKAFQDFEDEKGIYMQHNLPHVLLPPKEMCADRKEEENNVTGSILSDSVTSNPSIPGLVPDSSIDSESNKAEQVEEAANREIDDHLTIFPTSSSFFLWTPTSIDEKTSRRSAKVGKKNKELNSALLISSVACAKSTIIRIEFMDESIRNYWYEMINQHQSMLRVRKDNVRVHPDATAIDAI